MRINKASSTRRLYYVSVVLLLVFLITCCGGGDGDRSGTPLTSPQNTPDLLDDEGFPRLIPTRWTYLGAYSPSSDDEEPGLKVYLDYYSIWEAGTTGFSTIWILTTYTEKSARQADYFPIVWYETQEIYDCENERWDVLRAIGENLNQEIIKQEDYFQDSREWSEIFIDTLGEDILNAGCDY